MGLRRWIADRIAAFLTRPLQNYEHRTRHDFDRLHRQIRKGDVLLVEGNERVSAVIKTLTQSCWSHAALYIGDEMLRRGGETREMALDSFGPEGAQHLLVEALFEGVALSPLEKYQEYHLRLCRPHRLRSDDLQSVIDDAVSSIGWPYDLRNILDLARHLLMLSLMPTRYRRAVERLGSSRATEVICSSLLGQLFHRVGFPVLPTVLPTEEGQPLLPSSRPSVLRLLRRERDPYPGIFLPRHPTLLAPRDFDLSPYFEIVKFDAITGGGFDYQRIAWAKRRVDEGEVA